MRAFGDLDGLHLECGARGIAAESLGLRAGHSFFSLPLSLSFSFGSLPRSANGEHTRGGKNKGRRGVGGGDQATGSICERKSVCVCVCVCARARVCVCVPVPRRPKPNLISDGAGTLSDRRSVFHMSCCSSSARLAFLRFRAAGCPLTYTAARQGNEKKLTSRISNSFFL